MIINFHNINRPLDSPPKMLTPSLNGVDNTDRVSRVLMTLISVPGSRLPCQRARVLLTDVSLIPGHYLSPIIIISQTAQKYKRLNFDFRLPSPANAPQRYINASRWHFYSLMICLNLMVFPCYTNLQQWILDNDWLNNLQHSSIFLNFNIIWADIFAFCRILTFCARLFVQNCSSHLCCVPALLAASLKWGEGWYLPNNKLIDGPRRISSCAL